MRATVTLLLQLFLCYYCSAQSVDQQLIVKWDEGYQQGKYQPTDLQSRKWLAQELRIELLTFETSTSAKNQRKYLDNHRSVTALEPNRKVTPRTDPNDNRYDQQAENFERQGYPEAWSLTPGGKTTDGQQIVIAILDAGFDVDHEDIAPNLWQNPNEIPGDFRDNDGNGYVDDANGYDFVANYGEISSNSHGTQVAGLVGARGNNNQGITGTNWDTRLMLMRIGTSAHIIEAYEYIRGQRRLYNTTNGAEGTFIVATNASFGIEGASCVEFPVWGALYNEMGQVGILTAAATANRGWDVEINGDMPTDCTSDFLIGVGNLGTNDLLWRSSAFGRISVDLAATGEGSYTTQDNNRYGNFGSTSAAAPYVTGAIALLYATPCPALLERTRNDPAGAALLVRQTILESVQPIVALRNLTVTEGLLDVAAAQQQLATMCEGSGQTDLLITAISPNPARNITEITTNALVFSEGATTELFDVTGRLVRKQQAVRAGSNPVRLSLDLVGLPAGAYQLRISERDRETVSWLIVR